jgi:hypothetical protein
MGQNVKSPFSNIQFTPTKLGGGVGQQAKDPELIGYATEIRLRAEKRAGELLREMEKNKGTRGPGPGRGKKAVAKSDRLFDPAPKLSDLGISKTQSSRWQMLADLKPDEFEAKVDRAKRKAARVATPRQ